MLYLQLPAGPDGTAPGPRLPITDVTARHLERALLGADAVIGRAEICQALATDGNAACWAMRGAEKSLGRTVNRIDEAADWLAGRLIFELAAGLVVDNSSDSLGDIEWRLPALVEKLAKCEQQLAEFESQLEREKLESLKELAYGASHEINNPLANIAARAQTLLEGEDDSERRRKLTAIHRQAMRAHEMIADLMLFARPPRLNLKGCELRQLVLEIVNELRDLAGEYGVEVAYEFTGNPIDLRVDATQLGVAIQAVIMNALEAVGHEGRVDVAVGRNDFGPDSFAHVTVSDNGPGISDEVRRHMFDPFYSGREAGRGLGFGLSKCWRIVTDHGGKIVVHQSASGGAEIKLLLPRTALIVGQS